MEQSAVKTERTPSSLLSYTTTALRERGLSVSITDLAGIEAVLPFEQACKTHACGLCMNVKEKAANVKICRRYKQMKTEYAVSSGKPFYDICPFGVLDYVSACPRETSYAVLFVTCTAGLLPRKAKQNALSIIEPGAIPMDAAFSMYRGESPHAMALLASVIERNVPAYTIAKRQQTQKSRIYLARAVIAEYFATDISLTRLAANLGVHKSVLARNFKSMFGRTIHEEINARRIDRAKTLIANGMGITDVAFDVGYNDASYFCKMFKKYTDTVPKDWRKERHADAAALTGQKL
ncbi:MAG: helix-turn-helix transcriptional regulator [Spirochaetes bacterium]|nr:helix-turn-helix transcriptional regulator [Spirochaetota bacterium]